MEIRVLVCGGRDFKDEAWVHRVLDDFDSDTVIDLIIHGNGGRWKLDRHRRPIPTAGADLWAGTWADICGVPCMVFPAAWRGLEMSAGPVRNGWELKFGKPNHCIYFPGGKGTANMVKQAEKTGVNVIKAEEI